MITMTKLASLMGAAAAVTLIGGVAGGHAVPTPSMTAANHQAATNSQTLVMDPTQSFAMTAKPSVKATPYWGEPKAG
jgi:hypothetical protein